MGALALPQTAMRGLPPEQHPDPSEAAICAISIDGEVMLVDVTDYHPEGRDLYVILRWDGSVGLEYAKAAEGRGYAGERTGYFVRAKGPKEPIGTRLVHEGCTVLGRVIGKA